MNYILLTILITIKGLRAHEVLFPKDFKFGVATAAYQIEGAWNFSGKGENIWDYLTHTYPERISDRTNGDVACDSYNLWQDDIQLLRDLKVDFYRFSLSWSRLLPTGFSNYINPDGVRYYNSIINALLQHNIEPMVTLYHWDLPQPLEHLGGWPNPLLAEYFEDYADTAFQLFGDRVKIWLTFNEPGPICCMGYGNGLGAPGLKYSGIADYLCGRTILLAHAKVYHLYRVKFKNEQRGRIGISVDSDWLEPKTQSASDIEAANRAIKMQTGWWLHPILSKIGDYPQIMKDRVGNISTSNGFRKSRLRQFTKQEVEYIRGTFDFLGLNHYTSRLVSNANTEADAAISSSNDIGAAFHVDGEWKKSAAVDWLYVVPWGFRKLLNWIKDEFDNPVVFVTENGWGDYGSLEDLDRINYFKGYLTALLETIHIDGCNVKAYTAWSLMDNMEWGDGYTKKFGLYYVNFTDTRKKRSPKASVGFYKKVIRTRRVPQD